jgi:hypothetical protein
MNNARSSLKTLAIATALVATLAPAKADPNALPAFRAISAYTLYRQAMTCEVAYVQHAEKLATAIADRAKEEQPSLNLEQSWRSAWQDMTGVPFSYARGKGECQWIVDRLEAILSAGKVM